MADPVIIKLKERLLGNDRFLVRFFTSDRYDPGTTTFPTEEEARDFVRQDIVQVYRIYRLDGSSSG